MLDDYRDSFPRLNGSDRPTELNAWDIEHFPLTQRLYGAVECCGALAQIDPTAERGVARGQFALVAPTSG
jgi:hypothetical protein